MTSASYTVRTAESHEYADALEVLIAAFDGDPAMMAVIAGGSRRQELAKVPRNRDPAGLRQLRGRGRIDIAIDNSTGKIVGVCLWNTPNLTKVPLLTSSSSLVPTTRLSVARLC